MLYLVFSRWKIHVHLFNAPDKGIKTAVSDIKRLFYYGRRQKSNFFNGRGQQDLASTEKGAQ